MNKEQTNSILEEFEKNGSINFTTIYDKNGTTLLMHESNEKYIVKISNKELKTAISQMNILDDIDNNNFLLSKIHYAKEVEYKGQKKTLEILDFIEGEPIRENSITEIKRLVIATKYLHSELNKEKEKYIDCCLNLMEVLPHIINSTEQVDLKKNGLQLLEDPKFQKAMNKSDNFLTFGDMWYMNILFSKTNVGFIDVDPIITGPEDLQFAILLTSNLLLQERYFSDLSLDSLNELYKSWGYNELCEEHLYSLCIFPLLTLSMKNVDIINIQDNKESIYYKLKVILEFVLSKIW